MSETRRDETQAPASNGRGVRIVSGGVAVLALAASVYLAKAGLQVTATASVHPLIRDHSPALLGLPIVVALATAIVCGARALELRSDVELLGLRAEGAGAAVLSWVFVFSALATALRALW